MAGRVVPLRVGDTELLVEVGAGSATGGSEYTSKAGDRLDAAVEAVTDTFGRARDTIVAIAAQSVEALGQARDAAAAPDEFEVKFGLKFSAKGSVVVAEASGEATLEVKLVYRADRRAAGPATDSGPGTAGAASAGPAATAGALGGGAAETS